MPRGSTSRLLPPGGADAATSALLSLLMFVEIFLYGANRTDLALTFCGLWSLALALVLLGARARSAIDGVRLRWVAGAFGLAVLMCAVALTPLAPGGAHPVWTWVAHAPSTASVDPYATVVEITKLLALGAVFVIGVVVGRDDEHAKRLIRSLLLVGLIYSIWALFDHALNFDFPFGFAKTSSEPLRLSASLVSANTAATLFGALAILNLVDLERKLERARSSRGYDLRQLERHAPALALPVVGFAASLSCLVLTASRTGLAVTLGVCIVLIGARALAQARRGGLSAPVIAVAVIVGGITFTSLSLNLAVLGQRLSFLDASLASRQAMFAAHWTAFETSPWSGYGLGSFERVNAMIMNDANQTALFGTTAAHNVYLQWLEEAGVLGAAPMFLCMALIIWSLTVGVARRVSMRSWLAGILAVTVLFLLHGVTDYALQVPAMATFLALLMGVGFGLAASRRRQSRPPRAARSARW